MSAFTRAERRLQCFGVQLTRAADNCDPGKFAVLQNVRSYVIGTIQARPGLQAKANISGNAIHSLIQVQDPTPFAGTSPKRYIGAGAALFAGPVNGPFPSIDTGYSGNPLSLTVATPPESPQPWLYVTDASRMRKVSSNGTLAAIGLAQPMTEPSASLSQLGFVFIQQFFGGIPWTSVGAQASAMTFVTGGRINTTISQILYDSGASGNCSIVPVSMAGFDDGIVVAVNPPGVENIVAYEITIAVATTSIAAIIYDSGTTGLCTIQPVASLGTGRTETPSSQVPERATSRRPPTAGEVVGRAIAQGTTGTPAVPIISSTVPTIHQTDFPVNALVTLGGTAETVRILSVAVGTDGVQSFRCSTAHTHAAGDSITGVSGFRSNTTGSYAAGAVLQEGAVQNIITPQIAGSAATGVATAGVQGTPATGFPPTNLALINGRSTLPDDDFHCSIKVDNVAAVTAVRVYLDVDASTNDFTRNYFFFEWGANDIVAAVQASNANTVSTLQETRLNTVSNQQLNTQPTTSSRPSRGNPTPDNTTTPGGPTAAAGVPSQLQLGNNQWLELRCKVRDLIRIGTDPSRTLANVAAAEILVAISGSSPVTVQYDSLWLSGGFGPDVGTVGDPYLYCYRYRASTTGAKSNPSPWSRGGMLPHRQSVPLTATGSSDAQADLIDWFRMGGTLTQPSYIGTCANAAGTVSFTDVIGDANAGGITLDFTNFQPWPTQDLSRSGTCNVAGTAIQRVSGDTFNTAWAPGSLVVVNNITCSIYKVVSSSLMFVNENAGSGTGLRFTLSGPTVMSQTFGTFWGGSIGQGPTYYFSCGDVNNPGYVLWSNASDPETASDANRLEITTPAEPLQNGFLYDGISFVASTENIYALGLTQSGNTATAFVPQIMPANRGFWTRWAFCLAPEGVYFLAKDGIYLSTGGSAAISITDADLYPLFPHDGSLGVTVNGYAPVDMTQTTRLRLTYVSGWLYFDYLDTNGASKTLAYWTATKAWYPDVYTPGISTRWASTGQGTNVELIGGANGILYTGNGAATDDGTPIAAHAQWTENQQDARREKLYRDLMLDADLGGTSATVTLGFTNNTTTLPPQTLGPSSGRGENFINGATQIGTYGLNLTVDLTWSPSAVGTPLFYLWDVAYQMTPELATSWLSGPTTHGLTGFQQAYMALIAYRSTGTVTLSVLVDNVTYTYALPSTGGQYAKNQVMLQAAKGMSFQWGMQGGPFQLFDKDCEIFVQPWGQAGGYQRARPF